MNMFNTNVFKLLLIPQNKRNKSLIFLLQSNGDDSDHNHVVADDPCLKEQLVGMCRAAIRRFHFDKESRQCKKFIYGGNS
jgi:hypothetical protein